MTEVTNVKISFDDPQGLGWKAEREAQEMDFARNERMWELYKGYVACKTYAGKQAYILEHAIINKGKFFSMSKRRQKRFLDTAFGLYCDIKLDKLVPSSRRNQRYITRINPVMKFVEKTGKAFDNMMNAWVAELLKD